MIQYQNQLRQQQYNQQLRNLQVQSQTKQQQQNQMYQQPQQQNYAPRPDPRINYQYTNSPRQLKQVKKPRILSAMKIPKALRKLQKNSKERAYLTDAKLIRHKNYVTKKLMGYSLKNTKKNKNRKLMYPGFPDKVLPPMTLTGYFGASNRVMGETLTGGALNVKFPDSPPVVWVSQQPFYSYI